MTASARPRVAVGCADHTGWAVLVTLAGDPTAMRVVDRRRVELVSATLPRMAYHAAAQGPRPDAARLIAEVEASALEVSTSQLRSLLADLDALGVDAVGIAVAAAGEVPADLDVLLTKHPLLHAAEGALYREALVEAAAALGLPVTRFEHRDAVSQAAGSLGLPAGTLTTRLTDLRRELGAPWNADHRSAAASALLTLGATR
ncbi:MAG: hypothetical protein ABWZ76_02775 [Acidimicrobiales bacterium]